MKYSIPSVDISPFARENASTPERTRTASDVANALEHVGSFYVKGSGIDSEEIGEWLALSKAFSELPITAKSALCPTVDSFEQGYVAVGEERSRGIPWHRESFGIGWPRDDDGGLWPDEHLLPHFRESVTGIYEVRLQHLRDIVNPTLTIQEKRLKILSDHILKSVSVSLGMNETWLGEQHTGFLTSLHLNHYPEVARTLLETGGCNRTGTHLDLDTLTFFVQDSVGGLEVAHLGSTDGENSRDVGDTAVFVPVSPRIGSILVSGGHMLARYTNGKWRGGVHRVSASTGSADAMCAQRFSLTFHVFPDPDVLVQSVHKYTDEMGFRKYKPTEAGEFLLGKRGQIYVKTERTTTHRGDAAGLAGNM